MLDDDEEPTRAIDPGDAAAAAVAVAPPPRTRRAPVVGRYELLLELASGGMATVYVGRQRGAGGFERLVAIKRLHPHVAENPELAASFMDEARIASLIRHPNVVSVHDVHEAEGEHLLVMDYIDGPSVAALVRAARKRGQKLPRPAALRIVIDALRGLHAAHEQQSMEGKPLGIVHRDATPHNILCSADGSVRLADFGIAKAAERSVHTSTGVAKGKFRYMAPEQARGRGLDRRVDVFAMGVVLWELLTGQRLFTAESDAEVLLQVSSGDVRAPSKVDATIPRELEAIVMRALATDPDARWATADAFASAIEQWATAAGELTSSADVASVVREHCGESMEKRRRELSDIVAGRAEPRVRGVLMSSPGGTGSTAGTSAPSTIDSVLVAPAVSEADLQRRARQRTWMVAGATVLLLASAAVVTLAAFSGTSDAPEAVAPSETAMVRVQVTSDIEVSEVRATGATNIRFTSSGATFEVPKSDDALRVYVLLEDGTEKAESIVPTENTAFRVRSTAVTTSVDDLPVVESAEPPPKPAPVPAVGAAPKPPPAKPKPKPAGELESNPYD